MSERGAAIVDAVSFADARKPAAMEAVVLSSPTLDSTARPLARYERLTRLVAERKRRHRESPPCPDPLGQVNLAQWAALRTAAVPTLGV